MTDKQLVYAREQRVVKANELIQSARYSLSLQEQRIILYLISMIKHGDTDFFEYELSVQDFCKICGIIPGGHSYKKIEDSIQDLRDKSIGWVTLENGERPLIGWIEKAKWTASGFIRIRLDEDLKPYLLNLKKHWTRYRLMYILQFRSKYSTRLYELIVSLKFDNTISFYVQNYDVSTLKSILDAENYVQYRDFKQRVLKPALDEINRYSDMDLKISEVKQGKRVVGLDLTISRKSGSELDRVNNQIHEKYGPEQMTIWQRIEENWAMT